VAEPGATSRCRTATDKNPQIISPGLHAAWVKERQDAKDELRAQVWLTADTSRRLRAIATRAGLRPEQVLAQLADQAVMGEDGTVTVPLFIPFG
jgi:cytidylate kinase